MKLDTVKLHDAILRESLAQKKPLYKCYEEIGNSEMVMSNLRKGKNVKLQTFLNIMCWLGKTDLSEFLK